MGGRTAKFFENVIPEPNSGCWLWTAQIKADGYGVARYNKKQGLAHRASWEMHNGPIPSGLCVLHRCDVRCCVNPDHLFLGSHADNMADMKAKGRRRNRTHGEKNPHSALTEDAVTNIRSSGESRLALAVRHGVGLSAIDHVRSGRSWKHVVVA
jgi:hypothetical protein